MVPSQILAGGFPDNSPIFAIEQNFFETFFKNEISMN
jgi:hypothetical protein